jgi:hypothetical protein
MSTEFVSRTIEDNNIEKSELPFSGTENYQ